MARKHTLRFFLGRSSSRDAFFIFDPLGHVARPLMWNSPKSFPVRVKLWLPLVVKLGITRLRYISDPFPWCQNACCSFCGHTRFSMTCISSPVVCCCRHISEVMCRTRGTGGRGYSCSTSRISVSAHTDSCELISSSASAN